MKPHYHAGDRVRVRAIYGGRLYGGQAATIEEVVKALDHCYYALRFDRRPHAVFRDDEIEPMSAHLQ